MRALLLLLGAGISLLGQHWPVGLPGAPALHLVRETDIPRWGTLYVKVAYYVDPAAAGLQDPLVELRGGQVWCGSRVTILQPISAKKRRESLEEQYRIYWPGGYSPQTAAAAQAFLKWANRALNQGDRLEYVVEPGGRLHARMNEGAWTTLAGEDLVRAWLGYTFEGTPKDPEILKSVQRHLHALRKGR
jgi:hypothetical protein